MQSNEPITIRRTKNGFIVFGVANTNTTSDFVGEDTMVFNTMADLQLFLSSHFEIPSIGKSKDGYGYQVLPSSFPRTHDAD